ncbi:MAG: HPF/RaiA family ribosome-associated protein [Pseudomonadota bacterium]
MTTNLEITFHGVEKSEAIEARIREKHAKLGEHHARITRCRVVVEAPHRKGHQGKVYHVKIEISLPGHAPIVVGNEREASHDHEDVYVALRDAFAAARRRLDDVVARMAGAAKAERSRRRPAGSAKGSGNGRVKGSED